MTRPARYRLEGIPGLDGATARELDPPALQLADTAQQGVLPFSDGSHLGPLFNTTTTAPPPAGPAAAPSVTGEGTLWLGACCT